MSGAAVLQMAQVDAISRPYIVLEPRNQMLLWMLTWESVRLTLPAATTRSPHWLFRIRSMEARMSITKPNTR
jgi:hypothetical protein